MTNVAMPTFATAALRRYFDLGRVVRCVLPLGKGRLMHMVVAYGFQGADEDAEKLSLTDQFFDAALCELALVGKGQSCVIAGGFNVEPTKVPWLLKGISAGLWVDLQGAWARAAGVDPDVPCKRDWACLGGTRRTLFLGVPWRLLLWEGAGLMAVVRSSLIFQCVLLFRLLAGLLRLFSL